jgi:hypothetical protein
VFGTIVTDRTELPGVPLAVTAEIGRALSTDFTSMSRYNANGMATAVAMWTGTDGPIRKT